MSRQSPILLTPGPITVEQTVLDAMGFCHNPGDVELIEMTRDIRRTVQAVGNAAATHECVPLQGSATYAVEAVLHACVPRTGKVLVVNNGFYGLRAKEILDGVGIACSTFDVPGFDVPDLDTLDDAILADPAITHVFVCQVETGTGILNPAEAIARLAKARGKGVIVDAVAAFGAVPLDVGGLQLDAVVASANKCFEGVPGVGLPLIRRDILEASKGRCPSLVLDLHARWRQYEEIGHWRFTPVTQVIAALHAAMRIHAAEGGAPARLAKYERNRRALVAGMRAIGIETLIPDSIAAPIIATFLRPQHPAFAWEAFFAGMKARGFWLFNGKLTSVPTFRIGCMGAVTEADMAALALAAAETLQTMGVMPAPVAAAAE